MVADPTSMISAGSWAGAVNTADAVPLQSVERDCGGPISVRLSGEVHDIETVTQLDDLVRSLVGEARAAKRVLWVRRAMVGWVFWQLKQVPGPLTTSGAIGEQFGMNLNTVRAWIRFALRVVDQQTGSVDTDLVADALKAYDAERSRKAVTSRQQRAADQAAQVPLDDRSQHEIETALGTRTEKKQGVPTVTPERDVLSFGEQMELEELFDVASGVRSGLVDVESERLAMWLRSGDVVISRRVADELGLDVSCEDVGEQQRATADGPPGRNLSKR